MDYEGAKAALLWNWAKPEPEASEVYTDDALVEFPQSPGVVILHFRGELIDRETIYAATAFPPAPERALYAEQSPLDSTPGLPVRVRGA